MGQEEVIPGWAVRMQGSIERLSDKVDRVGDDLSEVKCAAQETSALITGGDRPEHGLAMKLDRLNISHEALRGRVDEHESERREIKREARQAVWSAAVAGVVGFGGVVWAVIVSFLSGK